MALQSLCAGQSDPVLALDDIQGDVLIGLQKDCECFLFFTIDDAAAFSAASTMAVSLGLVTSARVAKDREALIAGLKASGNPSRVSMVGLNIGLAHPGIGKLLDNTAYAAGTTDFDASFVTGAASRAPHLGDDTTQWLPAFTGDPVDGALLITGRDAAEVDAHADAVLALFAGALTPVHRENGMTRAQQRGHEQFGFLDGISQPGIRGLTARQNANDPDQGLPGQDLVWPGEFVFGYEGQNSAAPGSNVSKNDAGPKPAEPFAWMSNGSFMVWRRLKQDVGGFQAAVTAEAARLEMDATLLSARMVGRWPSGAPIVSAPLQDDRPLASDERQNNDFEFDRDDPDQRRCPYAAHIRKTYPRDDLNPLFGGESGEAAVQTRRIRRAGIPYGPDFEAGADDESDSRGLMFVCYQTSIQDQFEFIQQDWANSATFVPGKPRPPGLDPIIGQGAARTMDEPLANYPTGSVRSQLTGLPPFVTTTGAGYFFMPSLSALKTVF